MTAIQCILLLTSIILGITIAEVYVPVSRIVTITAQDQIYLKKISYNEQRKDIPTPVEGSWQEYKNHYCWFGSLDDDRIDHEITKTIKIRTDLYYDTALIFSGNRWKGEVAVTAGGHKDIVDTFRDSDDFVEVTVPLTPPTVLTLFKRIIRFELIFAGIVGAMCSIILSEHKAKDRFNKR